MKKHILFILACSISAFATQTELSISVNTMNMDYREYNKGSIVDSEKSKSLTGVGLQYKHQLSNTHSFIDVDYALYHGDTDYVGSVLYDPHGVYGDIRSTTDNIISDSSIGYSQEKLFDNYLVSMRLGVGYRFWERALSDGNTEQYSWPYGTVKLGISGNMSGKDTLGVSAEYHQAFSPQMNSNKFGTFDLGRTDGFSIIVPWEHTLSPVWALKFSYMYQTWNINKSDINGGYVEPDSESKFHTLNATLAYCY
jgi:hypothetical protein